MSEPSPPVLRAYAEELRELARAQAGRAASCATLLDAVTRLDDEATWQGTYPTETHATFRAWAAGLKESARNCEEQASSWRARAADLDRQADAAPAAS